MDLLSRESGSRFLATLGMTELLPAPSLSHQDHMSTDFDIVIVGGGLVGASLACALEGSGRRVALLEAEAPRADAQAQPPSFDERNLALAAASLNALDALGVLRHLATAPAPIRRIHISRACDFGAVRLAAADYARDAFGAVVVARDLGAALEARLGELRSLTRLRPARVAAVADAQNGRRRIEVQRDGGRGSLRARLLVAADGTRSAVREALGIATDEHDYGQTLFVCSAAGERPPDGTAYERFTGSGPVALLPRPDGHYGAICGVARDEAPRVAALDDVGYADYLQQRFGWRAGRILRVGRRSAYPIVRATAQHLTAPHAIVMGNAAQTIHPIGAQGFNLGLRDALTYAELLRERAADSDPAEPFLLAAYADARHEDRERTLAFSDGLARLTANGAPPLRALRSLGLLAVQHVAGLRDPLVGGAMGFRGRVPDLARARP